jgi:hypothetical protein
MRRLLSIAFLLISSSASAQHSFTFQELLDIYLTKDKVNAMQVAESKGYTEASAEDFRKLFGRATDNHFLYNRKQGASKIGFVFVDNKISDVIFTDSIAVIKSLLVEVTKMNFELVNQHGEISKVYVKRKTNYFVDYEIMDESQKIAMISIMLKNKKNRVLYNPKR